MLILRSFNRFILISLVLLGLSVSSASAVVVGDKDWYQVSDLTSNSWNDFDAIFDATTGACDVAGCLLGGTTDLTGYTWASNADVNSLIAGYYAGPGLNDSNAFDQLVTTGPATLDGIFTDFVTTSDPLIQHREYLWGYTRESVDAFQVTSILIWDWTDPVEADFLEKELHNSEIGTFTDRGGWVYRDLSPVPVPAAVWLFGTALIGLVGFGKRKKAA